MKKAKAKSSQTKKIKLQRSLRLAIIAILGIILILSVYNVFGAYQQPTTSQKTVPIASYIHTGKYDYNVYLKDSILFGNNITLTPGEGTYFKKLIDRIEGSFTYQFNVNYSATIEGSYKLTAQIKTNIWSKSFTLKPTTPFESSTNSAQFTFNFPIDYEYFEEYITKINEETGVAASESALEIICTVLTTAETTIGETIREAYTPSIIVTLGGTIVNIEGELATTQTGSIDTTEEIVLNEVFEQRTNMTILAIIFTAIFLLFTLLTKSKVEIQTQIEKQLKKIKKKYGEWIVETDSLPKIKKSESIIVKSFDDLVKISEEIGKPVIHYKAETKNPRDIHSFYVFDEDVNYKYILTAVEIIEKIAICPHCQTRNTCKGRPGEKIKVTCTSCGRKGNVTIEDTGRLKKKLKLP